VLPFLLESYRKHLTVIHTAPRRGLGGCEWKTEAVRLVVTRAPKKKAAIPQPPRKAARKAPLAPTPQSTLAPLRPLFEVTEDTPQYYVNHAEVTFNLHEFAITFARVPSRLTKEQWEKVMNSQPV